MRNDDVWIAWLLSVVFIGAIAIIFAFGLKGIANDVHDLAMEQATIGGTTVPAVHCQEDEMISWLGPDWLGCVHYEEVK